MAKFRAPRVLGLTGPIAGGKTAAAGMLGRRGARVIELDAVGHELLAEPAVRAEVAAAFPPVAGVADPQELRRRLAEIVFADPRELARLERILHVRMCARVRSEVAAAKKSGRSGLLVIAGALVFEMGLDELCDAVIFVDAPRAERLRRARASRGWTEEEVARREARQMPVEGKRLRADRVIDNAGTEKELEAAVAAIWEEFGCQ
jgi:dephospho-CoA kinase